MAELFVRARVAAVPEMPPMARPEPEVRAWVQAWDLDDHELWVAETDDLLLGFALLTPTWLDHLYVAPGETGRGVGSALLGLAQSLRPDGLGLWVFESNSAARRFYARHGFVERERTDGSENEERAADLRLEWPGDPA